MGSGSSKNQSSSAPKKQNGDHETIQHSPNTGNDNNQTTTSQPHNVDNVNVDNNNGNDINRDVVTLQESTQLLGFEPGYAEFPSCESLKRENKLYADYIRKKKVKVNPQLPAPNATEKKDLFDAVKLKKIDEIAIKAQSDLLQKPLSETISHLTKPCKSELEKVRAIFMWAALQDIEKLPKTGDDQEQTLWLLNQLKEKKLTHGMLFERLCKQAGITCVTAKGIVKASGYEVGDRIDFTQKQTNDWSIVRIDGQWKLLDLNFASQSSTGGGPGEWELVDDDGKAKGQNEDKSKTIQTLNDHFFLTDPEEFIYNHYPLDKSHQLLARSVTESEYQEMAFLDSGFFKLGLKTTSSSIKGPLDTIDGEVDIDIQVPAANPRRFMYQLWRSTKDGTSVKDFKGFKFSQFVFIQQKENCMKCRITFPLSGKYRLDLFARDCGPDNKCAGNSGFDRVAKYLISCDVPKENWKAFPENIRMEWGPSSEMLQNHVIPVSHKDAVIESESGLVHMEFNTGNDNPITAKLRSNTKNDKQLQQYLLISRNNAAANLDIKLPDGGSYALDIYGKPDSKGMMPHLCTYLLDTVEGARDKTPFPDVPNQEVGATDANKAVGLEPLSHPNGYFTTDTENINIELKTPGPMDFQSEMYLQTAKGKDKIESHILVEQKDTKATFKTKFPKPGDYQINIFAKEKIKNDGLPNVYNYVVNVPEVAGKQMPFPDTLGSWADGCELLGNTNGILPCEEETDLHLTVPKAKDVTIIGKEWTKLKQNADGSWQGKVVPKEEDKSMQLCADFEGSGSFAPLLKYKTKSKKEIEAERKEAERIEREILEKKRAEEERIRKMHEEIENIGKDLKEALEMKDLEKLKKIIMKIEKTNSTQKFPKDYEAAKELIKSLERLRKLNGLILEMNQATMAEIRSYSKPPILVHDVMIAAFLLLRENESITKEWTKCQALCKATELNKRIRGFQFEQIHPEIAARARQILSKYRLDDVKITSAGAACFYAWVVGMVEELNIIKHNILSTTTPAGVKRQKELFKN